MQVMNESNGMRLWRIRAWYSWNDWIYVVVNIFLDFFMLISPCIVYHDRLDLYLERLEMHGVSLLSSSHSRHRFFDQRLYI